MPNDPALADLASRVATLLLLETRGDTVNLDIRNKGNAAVSQYLQAALTAPLTGMLDSVDASPSVKALMAALINQVGALSADNMVLKALMADDPLKTHLWNVRYQDPLTVLREMLPKGRQATEAGNVDAILQLGPHVLGTGWYRVENVGDNSFWRWSGPEKRASLVIPGFGAGHYTFSCNLTVLNSAVTGKPRFYINYLPTENVKVIEKQPNRYEATFEATVPQGVGDGYLILEVELDRTVCPAELNPDSHDTRYLGVGIGTIVVKKRAPALPSEPLPVAAPETSSETTAEPTEPTVTPAEPNISDASTSDANISDASTSDASTSDESTSDESPRTEPKDS